MTGGRPYKPPSLVRYDEEEKPPAALIQCAERRIAPHLHNAHMVDYKLKQLLVNVYLQGVYDTVESVANQKLGAEL